ncbi:hypothetical protein AVEN_187138-1 [Araneus ventricosus]|uniref:Uncharacterized protein n=1 Tax=Araneus ventricosus TaxID=182803 RepID=A0A4Y2SPA7_ARAVE|nr:hypothetical protein AVEN_187138-1 [Araneus ventricosus]
MVKISRSRPITNLLCGYVANDEVKSTVDVRWVWLSNHMTLKSCTGKRTGVFPGCKKPNEEFRRNDGVTTQAKIGSITGEKFIPAPTPPQRPPKELHSKRIGMNTE